MPEDQNNCLGIRWDHKQEVGRIGITQDGAFKFRQVMNDGQHN